MCVKIVDDGLDFYFHSSFLFYFIFLFLEQLGLGLSVTLSHQSQINGISHKTDHETWENGVEDSGTK